MVSKTPPTPLQKSSINHSEKLLEKSNTTSQLKQKYAESFGRLIENNEIIFDFDNRDVGKEAINLTGIKLAAAGYKFEIWYASGQQSPHLHVKDIHYLDLKGEQLQKYKKLFLLKYAPIKYQQFLDFQICGNHRIAAENQLHYKYNTIKRLLGVWNEDKENFAEQELIKEARQEEEVSMTLNPDAAELKDKIKITDIAKRYGLKVRGKMAICPFHEDKTPSLSLSNKKGIFHCFGCGRSGNIITFIKELENLKNEG